MISFTPDELKLLAADSVACDLCGHDGDTMLLSGNVRACKNNEECTGRIDRQCEHCGAKDTEIQSVFGTWFCVDSGACSVRSREKLNNE